MGHKLGRSEKVVDVEFAHPLLIVPYPLAWAPFTLRLFSLLVESCFAKSGKCFLPSLQSLDNQMELQKSEGR